LGGGSRHRSDGRAGDALPHGGIRLTLAVSAMRRLEFAQPRETRRVLRDVGMGTVRPLAQFIELAVGVRLVREAVHKPKITPV
jgi:hypothetical protein